MIRENIHKIINCLPSGVQLVVASKSRTTSEMREAIEAGALVFGENYIKEAQEKVVAIGNCVRWHLIGHLQKNKAKRAVKLFDMIETLDDLELAAILDKESSILSKIMPVLVEVNSASEKQKNGVLPDNVLAFVDKVSEFKHLRICGLMTMGPQVLRLEDIRPFFRLTHELFLKIKEAHRDLESFKYLSMGMSDSYKIALEEGASMVRLGNLIFGDDR